MYFTLKRIISLFFFCILIFCVYPKEKNSDEDIYIKKYGEFSNHFPKNICDKINKNKKNFLEDLNCVLETEKDDILILVDKHNLLDANHEPRDIILLYDIKDRKYVLDRTNIYLAKIAERPLQKMAEAARGDGIEIRVSSGYRSYSYQSKLFLKYEKSYGKKNALSFSALPGASQHQLGTVIDFGTITDEYADTPEGKWLFKNAGDYGWSLSYPKGMEKITGYNWECWHYRYLGVEACKFQKEWFDDIQQYMLEFIDFWKKEKAKLS